MALALCRLIVGLLIFGPFAAGAAADFWTTGIHDCESDNILQAVRSLNAVPAPVSLAAVAHVLVFVAVLLAPASIELAELRVAIAVGMLGVHDAPILLFTMGRSAQYRALGADLLEGFTGFGEVLQGQLQ